MRPQQNRRVRGRNNNGNNNNRRGPNPLSRNYESSGPDVKIRGNAQQIADKYLSLARDAQGSGDRVMSENYLQHAEHYLRIILAAVAQMPQSTRREESSEQECDEINSESANKDDISFDKHKKQKKNGNSQQAKTQNGYVDDDALKTDAVSDQISDQKQFVVQENSEPVKRTRRTSRRRVMVNQEASSLELEKVASGACENGEASAEKVSSLPLLTEETPKKTRRRRVATPRVETSSAEGNI
ncbi:DUF4167 domain-containing protein [Bartonella sp. B30(2025)]